MKTNRIRIFNLYRENFQLDSESFLIGKDNLFQASFHSCGMGSGGGYAYAL